MRLLQCGQYMQCLLRIGFQVIVHQVVDKHRATVWQFVYSKKRINHTLSLYYITLDYRWNICYMDIAQLFNNYYLINNTNQYLLLPDL